MELRRQSTQARDMCRRGNHSETRRAWMDSLLSAPSLGPLSGQVVDQDDLQRRRAQEYGEIRREMELWHEVEDLEERDQRRRELENLEAHRAVVDAEAKKISSYEGKFSYAPKDGLEHDGRKWFTDFDFDCSSTDYCTAPERARASRHDVRPLAERWAAEHLERRRKMQARADAQVQLQEETRRKEHAEEHAYQARYNEAMAQRKKQSMIWRNQERERRDLTQNHKVALEEHAITFVEQYSQVLMDNEQTVEDHKKAKAAERHERMKKLWASREERLQAHRDNRHAVRQDSIQRSREKLLTESELTGIRCFRFLQPPPVSPEENAG